MKSTVNPTGTLVEAHAFSTDLEALAGRARARRISLPMRGAYLSRLLGVSRPILQQWELCLPSPLDPEVQAKWEAALEMPPGWLLDLQIQSQEERDTPLVCPAGRCNTMAELIRAVGLILVRPPNAAMQAEIPSLATTEKRNVELFASRYGVHGEAEATQRTIGLRHGITGERVRHLVGRLEARSVQYRFDAPILKTLRGAMAPLLPGRVEAVDARLASLLGESLSIVGAQRFSAAILRRSLVSFHEADV